MKYDKMQPSTGGPACLGFEIKPRSTSCLLTRQAETSAQKHQHFKAFQSISKHFKAKHLTLKDSDMNTAVSQPSTPILSTSPAIPEINDVVPDSLANALPKKKKRRPIGKIAELPQEQKDFINQMLDDGKTYKVVEEEMANLGVSLNGENISNWFNGPYQDYVRDREWREDLFTLAQSASAIDGLDFGQKFQESLIQLAFVDIFRGLKDPETRADRLNHIRLLNTLARLNREALCVRKYNDLRADAAPQPVGATRAPTAEEICNSFLTGFEKVHGIKPADAPIGPDLNILLGLDQPSSLNPNLNLNPTPISASASRSVPADSPQPDGLSGGSRRSEPVQTSGTGVAIDSLSSSGGEGRGEEAVSSRASDCLTGRSASRNSEGRSQREVPAESDCSRRSNEADSPNSDPCSSVSISGSTPSPIEIQKSKINPSDSTAQTKTNKQKTTMTTKNSDQPSLQNPTTPSLQHSTIPSLPSSSGGHCHRCSADLPPLKPDGTRPSHLCPACQTRLYPPDTTFDRCQICDFPQPIRPSGERYSDSCQTCGQKLPPPGQRYVTECPGCGLHLHNFTEDGSRISDRCRDCRTLLPLLEPIPPPPAGPKQCEGGPNTLSSPPALAA